MVELGIETIGLTKKYADVVAVCGLSLQIARGEIFALVGPNGAGKTTTIRLLAGLLDPTSGLIRICGLDPLNDRMNVKKKLGYIPDIPFFYEKLTAHEFMYFMGSFYGLSPQTIEARQKEFLERFGLLEVRDHIIESLSHGMKRRLNFCATLLHEPQVLLVDEPMVGLDPKSSKIFRETLQGLSQSGVAIILSTHSLNLVEELAHRVGVIHHGRLIHAGSVNDIKRVGKNAKDLESAFLQITDAV